MQNPSDNSCPDIALASVEKLVEMAKSKDKLLGCAARDELKRREKPGEAASPELCAALGIDAKDLHAALPEDRPTHFPRRAGGSQPPLPQHRRDPRFDTEVQTHIFDQPTEAMLKEAAESMAGESVKTKEAVVTTVATYLANKDANWWMHTPQYREKEMFFVVKMLVHTYTSLENP